MNQKPHTARSGLAILFALLCIVCLSLSLALSAHFAAYAEGEETAGMPMFDGENRPLWQIHYMDGEEERVENLWNGVNNDEPISYVSVRDGVARIEQGTAQQIDCFAPYRNAELTLKLNPEYVYAGTSLADRYDLTSVEYGSNVQSGLAGDSLDVQTTVTLTAEGQDDVVLTKNWKVVSLCNLIDVSADYIVDYSYADMSVSCDIVSPQYGSVVIYDFSSRLNESIATIAVERSNNALSYKRAYLENGAYMLSEDEDVDLDNEVTAAANGGEGNLINYKLHRLSALVADAESEQDAYTLKISSMPHTDENGIYYAGVSVPVKFSVKPQSLGDNEGTVFSKFTFGFVSSSSNDLLPSINAQYTGNDSWLPEVKLYLGNIEFENGVDYTLELTGDKIGDVQLKINGMNNLEGSHTVTGKIRITPADNEWRRDAMPGIITWVYGTYKPENNLIIGTPTFLENVADVKFRIVALDERQGSGVSVVVNEREIEGLGDIHYNADNPSDLRVTDDVSAILATLSVGKYRLYASVYGATVGSSTFDRYYLPIEETSVDFEIFKGTNSWKAGSEPSILGWTTGKLDNTDGLMNAESVFGTPILMIYKVGEKGAKDTLIYSNLENHANTEFGDINVLKKLKAGRYYLSAEVKGTDDYTGLKSTVLFDVAPNNLPIWATILIVAGSLGIVAVVFAVLHQKGILQMLTGKVLLSMRTRANVDATLAAIRAAKVAREAEASIAAAKAREAEEAAKSETATESDKSEK